MNLARLICGVLLSISPLLLSGCAGTGAGEGYGGLPDNPAAAGGAALPPPGNAAYGAYPGPAAAPALQNSAPPAPPPPAPFSADHDVAAAIHRLFNHDEYLAPASKHVTAKVYKGVVTLRGTVPSEHERDEIVQRLSQLPGVDRVDDQLKLEGPH
jgi:hypothetical protein